MDIMAYVELEKIIEGSIVAKSAKKSGNDSKLY
jgi:hypothetical protein